MYFITVDENQIVTGVYNGDMDYVHRITGDPIRGARPIPDDAIRITTDCYNTVRNAPPGSIVKQDLVQECLVVENPLTLEGKRAKLKSIKEAAALEAEYTRIDGLTEAEIDAELGA